MAGHLKVENLPSDPDHKSQFGLSWDIVVACLASHPTHADFTPVHLPVFLMVSFSSLEDELPGDFVGLMGERRHTFSVWALC